MNTLEIILRLLAGLVLTLMNAFFVVTEFALTRVRQFDESEFSGDPRLQQAWKMTERLEFYLTGCQLGISATSILLGVLAEPAVSEMIRPLMDLIRVPEKAVPTVSVVIAVILINLIHKIWGEQAPTYLGVERPKQVARMTAPLHYWWCKITYPAIYAGDGLAKWTLRLFGIEMQRSWTKKEKEEPEKDVASYSGLREAMGEILTRGGLPKDRRREVLRAMEIDKIPVKDIMVKRKDIVAVSTSQSIQENLKLMANRRRFARFPLVGESLDDVLGILYVPEMFRHIDALRSGELSLEELAAPPMFVPADLPVSKLIDRFQQERQEMTLVKSDGRVMGLVTITETLEAIAGELEDPFDRQGSS